MKEIAVLMSTYNGERYLKTQIDSILAQEGVNVGLLVRDDGSTDNTLSILQQYANQCKLTYYTGANLKPARSFMDLVVNAPMADYYAFSDQDDYWLPQKLLSAVKNLNQFSSLTNRPCLYYCRPLLVDANLVAFNAQLKPFGITNFRQAVVMHNAPGCTMVFNQALLNVAKQYTPSRAIMHDSWLLKLCLAVGGKVVYEKRPFIYYRQHGRNVCGRIPSFKTRWQGRLHNWFGEKNRNQNEISELLQAYRNQMLPENIIICDKISQYTQSWKQKWQLLKDISIQTGNLRKDWVYRFKVLLGRF